MGGLVWTDPESKRRWAVPDAELYSEMSWLTHIAYPSDSESGTSEGQGSTTEDEADKGARTPTPDEVGRAHYKRRRLPDEGSSTDPAGGPPLSPELAQLQGPFPATDLSSSEYTEDDR